jgi:hypothetical protein
MAETPNRNLCFFQAKLRVQFSEQFFFLFTAKTLLTHRATLFFSSADEGSSHQLS